MVVVQFVGLGQVLNSLASQIATTDSGLKCHPDQLVPNNPDPYLQGQVRVGSAIAISCPCDRLMFICSPTTK